MLIYAVRTAESAEVDHDKARVAYVCVPVSAKASAKASARASAKASAKAFLAGEVG